MTLALPASPIVELAGIYAVFLATAIRPQRCAAAPTAFGRGH